MVRLIDIAKRCGVSQGTVSAVLSERDSGAIRFSKEKAAEIRAVARELNYIPNFSARVLNRQSSKTLGVLIESNDSPVRFQQLAAIEREAGKFGYRLMMAEAQNDPEKQCRNYQTLRQYGVDGVICHANTVHAGLDPADRTVFFGAEPVPGFSTAYYDIGTGYAAAAEQFRREGRRKVVLVTDPGNLFDSQRARRRAFLEEYPGGEGNVIPWQLPETERGGIRERTGELADRLLAAKADAVILQNDAWCLTLAGELKAHGVRIPQEISLVGQDNSFFGACAHPALTTIDSNLAGLGAAVVELMLERIRQPEAPIRPIAVPTLLIRRETTLSDLQINARRM